MELIFAGLFYEKALVYLDDVIAFGRNFDEHLKRLELVFQSLVENGLKIKGSQRNFLQKRVSFLGHIISESGFEVDPEKVRAIERNERTIVPEGRQGLSRPCGLLSEIYSGFRKNSSTFLQFTEELK